MDIAAKLFTKNINLKIITFFSASVKGRKTIINPIGSKFRKTLIEQGEKNE
jgi:hypothetical protein